MVATASTEMGSTIEEIARNTEQAANNAQTTNNKAMEGRSAVENTVSQIRSLADNLENSSREVAQLQQESETIGSVLDVIRGIAEQTNLLALNAAIEAARAGIRGAVLRWWRTRCAASPSAPRSRPRRSPASSARCRSRPAT